MTSLLEIYNVEEESKLRNKDEYVALDRFLFDHDDKEFYLMDKFSKKEHRLLYPAVVHLCNYTGYPKRIADKLPSNLVKDSVQYLINKSQNSSREHLLRFDSNKNIRGILSNQYEVFDNSEMLSRVISSLGEEVNEWEVSKLYKDVSSFHVRLTKKTTRPLIVGEPVKDALHLTNSEVGFHSFEGKLCSYICKCTNGLISIDVRDSFSIPHIIGVKKEPIRNLKDLLERGNATWLSLSEGYNKASEIVVSNPMEFMEIVSKDYTLGKKVSELVLEHYRNQFVESEPNNLREISDVFTELAHKNYSMGEENYGKLELIGSSILRNYEKYLGN